MNVSKITKEELKKCLDHFERLSNTYFWNPPSNASSRRKEEEKNTRSWTFEVDGKHVIASVVVSCSCRNYYTTRTITVNNENKKMMIPFLKKCIASMEAESNA